jgi:hypothetical protein
MLPLESELLPLLSERGSEVFSFLSSLFLFYGKKRHQIEYMALVVENYLGSEESDFLGTE